jgi:hypothetical protein
MGRPFVRMILGSMLLMGAIGVVDVVGPPRSTLSGQPLISLARAGETAAEDTGPGAKDPFVALYARDFARVHALAAAELDSAEISAGRKLTLLQAEATAYLIEYLEKGDNTARGKAAAAMKAMLALDARADFVPGFRFPEPVHELFRDVRQEWFHTHEAVADPTRVAVAPFYLIDLGGSQEFNWQGFAQALPFLITDALQAVSGLTLLSREHMQAIKAELNLASQQDLVSKENRLRLGQLLSASSFVYGELQVLPGDEVHFEIRWVQTETGATLLAGAGHRRVRSGRQLLELQQQVLFEEFVPQMVAALSDDLDASGAGRARDLFKQKMSIAGKGDSYLHYVAAVASATVAEQAGRHESALEHWRSAARVMPTYSAPKERVAALELLSSRVRDTQE